jgi:cytochrome c oxidase cbb3-type subunit 2
MISRFPVFLLVLFSTAVFPWLLLIFKSEQQLINLQPVSLEQEDHIVVRDTGKSFETPEEYIAHISETGGSISQAKKDINNAIKEWEVKTNTRAKARQPLLRRKANVVSEPLYPHFKGGAALAGKRVYQAQGCFHCHTQQVRQKDFGVDIARGWGKRRSVARDYIYDEPVLLGRTRIGPDLANIGMRVDSTTLLKHLYSPPHGSNMPSYSYFFKKQEIRGSGSKQALHFDESEFRAPKEGWEIVPKASALDLVAYLLSLKQDYELPEATNYPVDEDQHHVDEHAKGEHTENKAPNVDPKLFAKGKKIYNRLPGCVQCHQSTGLGLPGLKPPAAYPPLADSDWINKSDDVLVRIILNGITGSIKVNNIDYNFPGGMLPAIYSIPKKLSDIEIAAVITYIRNEWGNQGPVVTEDTVKRIRAEVGERTTQWTAEELGTYLK